MGISDWSSDVCSSDLGAVARVRGHAAPGADRAVAMRHPRLAFGWVARGGEAVHEADLRRPSVLVRQRVEVEAGGGAFELGRQLRLRAAQRLARLPFLGRISPLHDEVVLRARSEEHTSELQSLMRIS